MTKYGHDGENVPFIRGSAKGALEHPADPQFSRCISDLLEAMDRNIPEPKRAIDMPFLMPIEAVHTIDGRGTVATGKIEQGVITVGTKAVGTRLSLRATSRSFSSGRRTSPARFACRRGARWSCRATTRSCS